MVGLGALGLGFVGAVLPVLPTTPFVILAAFAFGKSSPRLRIYLENNKIFGPIIADWQENGVIAARFKAIALGMMAGALVITSQLSVPLIVLLIQASCMTGAALFILSRPSSSVPSKSQPTASQ